MGAAGKKRRPPTALSRAMVGRGFAGMSSGMGGAGGISGRALAEAGRQIDQVQRAADEATRRLGDVELLDGVAVEVALTTSSQDIEHKLGRVPLGFIVVDLDANATVWRTDDATKRTIPLRASAACNAKVWVY